MAQNINSEPLTDQQQLFCDQYLVDLNGKQAAIRAGYSEKTAEVQASRLLSYAKVQEYIKEKQNTLSEKLSLDAEWVLIRLKEISDRCVQAEPVMIRNAEGELVESGEYKFDSSGANRSTELIGKHLGMFGDKLDVTSKGQPLKMITGFKVIHTKKDAN
jgi:phage terminase small subunit